MNKCNHKYKSIDGDDFMIQCTKCNKCWSDCSEGDDLKYSPPTFPEIKLVKPPNKMNKCNPKPRQDEPEEKSDTTPNVDQIIYGNYKDYDGCPTFANIELTK